ncbi:21053_t:CDS:1, partial [Rhizophagus irregularis]
SENNSISYDYIFEQNVWNIKILDIDTDCPVPDIQSLCLYPMTTLMQEIEDFI